MNGFERFSQGMTKIIDFEGLDCCFKETNSKFLTDCLLKWGLKGKRYSFPNYDSPSSYFVKRWLSNAYDGLNLSVKKDVETIFLLDQMDTLLQIAKEAEEEDFSFIVLDRFWPSGIYYNSATNAGGIKSRFDSINAMRKRFQLPFPDVIIGMESTMPLIIDGINRRTPVEERDKNESDHSFLQGVHQNFKILMNNIKGYKDFKYHESILERIQVYCPSEKDPSMNVLKTREELWEEFLQLANKIAVNVIGVTVC